MAPDAADRSETGRAAPKVLIAGGGVAGLESVLGLRRLCGDRVSIELLDPRESFVYRPLAVAEPFELTPVFEIGLERFAEDNGATLRRAGLERVDTEDRSVLSSAGDSLDYDYLVIATGARVGEGVPGALSFVPPGGIRDFNRLLYRLERGEVQRVAFTARSTFGWFLPMYELALMTATFMRARQMPAQVTVVTPETAPLEVFGGEISAEVARLLAEANVRLETERRPLRFETGGRLQMAPDGFIETDQVVALPGLEGPGHEGLPAEANGFVPMRPDGRVDGREREFAAGDATDFPVKQGGIAAQMADAAVSSIAYDLGAVPVAEPFEPTIEGTLLTGRAVHELHHSLVLATSETADRTEHASWLPAQKVWARYLGEYLAEHSELKREPAEVDSDRLAGELRESWQRRVVGRRA